MCPWGAQGWAECLHCDTGVRSAPLHPATAAWAVAENVGFYCFTAADSTSISAVNLCPESESQGGTQLWWPKLGLKSWSPNWGWNKWHDQKSFKQVFFVLCCLGLKISVQQSFRVELPFNFTMPIVQGSLVINPTSFKEKRLNSLDTTVTSICFLKGIFIKMNQDSLLWARHHESSVIERNILFSLKSSDQQPQMYYRLQKKKA